VQRTGRVVHACPHLARLHPLLHVLHIPLPACTLAHTPLFVLVRLTHTLICGGLWLTFNLPTPSFALACAFNSPAPLFALACAVDSPVPSFDLPTPSFAMACVFDSPCSTCQCPHLRQPVQSTHLCPHLTRQRPCLQWPVHLTHPV
jgi:hypothetical protein